MTTGWGPGEMPAERRRDWVRAASLLALVYVVVGLLSGELASRATTEQSRVVYRRAAWLVSAAFFAGHVGYERSRRRAAPSAAALRAAGAAAMGACGLAAVALVRALSTGTGRPGMLAIALVAWPLITAVPAFLVALALGYLFPSRWRVGS
jgi:hypothetical protein